MALSVHHVFLLTPPGAPEGDALVGAGLDEGTPNTHPGQGTACRRFFLAGTYLELLWIRDRAEALGEPAAMLRLVARAESGCPIGLCLHAQPEDPSPFPTTPYAPSYLPPGTAFPIATASDDPRQPLVFLSPFPPRSTGPEVARVVLRGPWNRTLRKALANVTKLETDVDERWSVELHLTGDAVTFDVPGLPLRLLL